MTQAPPSKASASEFPKELRPFLRAARKAGWGERRCDGGVLLYPPNGERAVPLHSGSSTKVRARTVHKLKIRLRRGGLNL